MTAQTRAEQAQQQCTCQGGWEKPTRPQNCKKNSGQLRNAESGRNSLPQGR